MDDNVLQLYRKILEINHLPGIFFVYKTILNDEGKVVVEEGNIKEYNLSTLNNNYNVMEKNIKGNNNVIKIETPKLFFVDYKSKQFLLRFASEIEDFKSIYNCHCNKGEFKLLSAFHSILVSKAVNKLYSKQLKIQFK